MGNPILRIGKFKGAPPTEILYRLQGQDTPYFFMRYYPQRKSQDPVESLKIAQRRHFEDHLGVYNLDERLVFSFILSISQTSKSAVIRRRIMHRLATAFRITLKNAGPVVIPAKPMNILLTPKMALLNAPFEDIKKVAIESFWAARRSFEALSEKKQAQMTPRMRSKRTGKRPEIKGDKHNLVNKIAVTIENLPRSSYLDSHGGAKSLLQKMQNMTSSSPTGPPKSAVIRNSRARQEN